MVCACFFVLAEGTAPLPARFLFSAPKPSQPAALDSITLPCDNLSADGGAPAPVARTPSPCPATTSQRRRRLPKVHHGEAISVRPQAADGGAPSGSASQTHRQATGKGDSIWEGDSISAILRRSQLPDRISCCFCFLQALLASPDSIIDSFLGKIMEFFGFVPATFWLTFAICCYLLVIIKQRWWPYFFFNFSCEIK